MNMELSLLEPYDYLKKIPGKQLRSKLTEAFNIWLQLPASSLQAVDSAIEMLHNASLMIDDIEDYSPLRRGVQSAHIKYGIPITLNCANYVYFLALQQLLNLNDLKIAKMFAEELCHLHQGQGMDLYWRENHVCPTEEEYVDMVSKKTGGLLTLAVKVMQELSTSPRDITSLANNIGVYFQIRDDYMNLVAYQQDKGFCEDITEGKFSYPIIHCLKNAKSGSRLFDILQQRTRDPELLEIAFKEIAQAGSLDYTLVRMRQLEEKLRDEVAHLGGNDKLVAILDALKVKQIASKF